MTKASAKYEMMKLQVIWVEVIWVENAVTTCGVFVV